MKSTVHIVRRVKQLACWKLISRGIIGILYFIIAICVCVGEGDLRKRRWKIKPSDKFWRFPEAKLYKLICKSKTFQNHAVAPKCSFQSPQMTLSLYCVVCTFQLSGPIILLHKSLWFGCPGLVIIIELCSCLSSFVMVILHPIWQSLSLAFFGR